MKRLVVLVALLALGPVRAGVLQDILGASANGFLGAATDAALQALFERTRVVNPRMEAPLGIGLVTPGMTVELRNDEGSFDQARRVEEAFQRVLKVNSDEAMQFALEDVQLRQLIESGLKKAFAQAGCLEVLTADEISRWTQQRRDERANEEVRQGSLPARGTLERPFLVARWRWIPLAGIDFERWWQVVTTRNVVELTSQLSLSLQLADSGITVATFVVPVEVRAVGGTGNQERPTFGRPFIQALMTKSTDYLGGMLSEQARLWDQVCLGRQRLQVGPQDVPESKPGVASVVAKLVPAVTLLPRYRVFALYQRHAILTVGQEEALVGTGDADNKPVGSSVWVGGFEFKLGRTARRLSLISLDGQPLAAQEALSRPDAPVTWPNMPQPAITSGAAAASAPSAPGENIAGTLRVYKD